MQLGLPGAHPSCIPVIKLRLPTVIVGPLPRTPLVTFTVGFKQQQKISGVRVDAVREAHLLRAQPHERHFHRQKEWLGAPNEMVHEMELRSKVYRAVAA